MGCGASSASQQSSDAAPLLSQPDHASGDAAAGSVIIVSSADSTHTSAASSDVSAEQSAAHPHSATAAAASSSSSTALAAATTSSGAHDSRAASHSLSAPKPGHRHTLSHTEDRFAILKVLGEGASCKVVAVRDRRSGSHYAMKIMDKSEPYNGVLFENEALILRTLQHPNILQYVESYEDKNTFHLLTVLCQGGELFDRVKNGSFSEQSAAQLARQMLQALSYCHSHSIVHRDLKVARHEHSIGSTTADSTACHSTRSLRRYISRSTASHTLSPLVRSHQQAESVCRLTECCLASCCAVLLCGMFIASPRTLCLPALLTTAPCS